MLSLKFIGKQSKSLQLIFSSRNRFYLCLSSSLSVHVGIVFPSLQGCRVLLLLVLLINGSIFSNFIFPVDVLEMYCLEHRHLFLYAATLQFCLISYNAWFGLFWLLFVSFSVDLLGGTHSKVDFRANTSGSLLPIVWSWSKLTPAFLVFLSCSLSIIIAPASSGDCGDSAGNFMSRVNQCPVLRRIQEVLPLCYCRSMVLLLKAMIHFFSFLQKPELLFLVFHSSGFLFKRWC